MQLRQPLLSTQSPKVAMKLKIPPKKEKIIFVPQLGTLDYNNFAVECK